MSPRIPPLPSWEVCNRPSFIKWEALQELALAKKQGETSSENANMVCELSATCSKGGRHIVRRLEFSDGEVWIVRVQKIPPTADSRKRLLNEVHAISAIQRLSDVPVPKVITYRATEVSPVGAAFTIQQYVHADTAMQVFGRDFSGKDQMAAGWEERYHREMAGIQTSISSVRFPMIGCITETISGYSVGPIPGIGGPFETPAEFFAQWATSAVFPYKEDTVKHRTPPEHFRGVWDSIQGFPSHVARSAESYDFMKGPFPVIHGDLYRSNILVDENCKVKAIIDWEDAFVGPWELVEFIKDLTTVPAAMNGPSYQEPSPVGEKRNKQKEYVEYVKQAESLDHKLSMVLSNTAVQDFATCFWLWNDGKSGYYTNVLGVTS